MTNLSTTTIPQIAIHEGKLTTTSRNVAEVFGKQHLHVMRDIKALEIPEDFRESNFGLCSYKGKNGQSYKMHDITRDGFTLLAMGFTGKKAMDFKLGYIAAFNKMEQELTQTTPTPTIARLAPEQKGVLHAIMDARCAGVPADRQASVRSRMWRVANRVNGVNSYHETPAECFEATKNLLANMDIKTGKIVEPKAIEAEPATPVFSTVTVNRDDLNALITLVELYRESYNKISGLEAAITMSAEAVTKYRYRTHDAVIDAANVAASLKKRLL